MVEFGLKLEDNKVSEWSEHYLDYEALKKILKKAKNAENKKDDLVEKNPELAKRIVQAHKQGEFHYITSPSSISDFSIMAGGTAWRPSPVNANTNDSHNGRFTGGTLVQNISNVSLPTLYSERTLQITASDGQDDGDATPGLPMEPLPTAIREGSDQSLVFTKTKEESKRGRIRRSDNHNNNNNDGNDQEETDQVDVEAPTEQSPLLMKMPSTLTLSGRGESGHTTPAASAAAADAAGTTTFSGKEDSLNTATGRTSMALDEIARSNRSTSSSTGKQKQSTLHKTFSSISDHLSAFVTSHGNDGSRYERNLRAALDELDAQTVAFDELFRKEQKKVVTFYNQQLQELGDRLEFVTETVAALFGAKSGRYGHNRNKHEGDADGMTGDSDFDYDTQLAMSTRGANNKTVSPFPTHRKQTSSMGKKVEAMIYRLARNTSSGSNHSSSLIGHRRRVTSVRLGSLLQGDGDEFDLNYDDEDDEDKQYEPHKMSKEEYNKRVAEAESIKRSLVSQYRIAKLLHNYAMINITGFVKIVKKFDKTVPEEKGRFKNCLESKNMLNDGKAVETLTAKYETYYANWFCEGDLRAAKAQILEKRGDGLEMDWSQLQLGYRMGMCAVLAVWVCWDSVYGLVADGKSTIGARAAFPVFRACGGLLLLQWFWGVSVFVWTRYRVNYIFLFDLIPRTVSTPFDLFAQAVGNTIPFLCLMLLYYKVSRFRGIKSSFAYVLSDFSTMFCLGSRLVLTICPSGSRWVDIP